MSRNERNDCKNLYKKKTPMMKKVENGGNKMETFNL